MFKGYYKLISGIGNNSVTFDFLEGFHRGFYKEDICNYIKYNIIEKTSDGRFKLTTIGKKLYRQELKIEEVISEYEI